MITQAGPRCDVCGGYILLDTSLNPFHCNGIEQELHCHDKCKEIIEKTKLWEDLPPGPLREVFEQSSKA